jgi:hypothetical protein
MSGKRKTPSEIPAGAPRRLARIGAAGAGVLARTALAGIHLRVLARKAALGAKFVQNRGHSAKQPFRACAMICAF